MNQGKTIAHYNILKPLGKGGMGEVYLAEDTKLKREVALKFLPEAVRGDPKRLRRFRTEAEAAAKLNHPNIATIYSIEEADEHTFITMEYVDGKTLSDHIPSDGLDIDQFFEWFIPLTDALAHAHEHGRIHRDLKPGNIMITSNGTPKILDFGLARIERESTTSDLDSDAPTRTMKTEDHDVPVSLTQGKSILGTPAYMSPEQIEGKKVDARTDIFSFGVVMYEVVTGQKPFKGDTVESIIARILEIDPEPLSSIKPIVPYGLGTIIRKCLVKNRDQRMQTSREMHYDLGMVRQEVQTGTVLVDTSSIPQVSQSTLFWRQPVAIVAMVLMLIAGGGAIWLLKPPPEPILRKFQWSVEGLQDPVISPDGKHIAYISENVLWIRNLENLLSQKISDTQNATQPSWSPDGNQICYIADNTLWKVPVTGGMPTRLCTLPLEEIRGVTWRQDGSIVVSPFGGVTSDIFTVSSLGGEPQPFLKADPAKGELLFNYPNTLPGGNNLLFTMRNDDGSHEIVAYSNDSRKTIVQHSTWIRWPVYSPTGHILYQLDIQGIWAVPFSPESLIATGEPFPIASNGVHPSISGDGTLVYTSTSNSPEQMVWVNRQGRIESTVGQPQEIIRNSVLSPDGLKLAVAVGEQGNAELWIYDLKRGNKNRLASHPANDVPTTWSPSGDRVVFHSYRSGGGDLFSVLVDGSGRPQKLVDEPRGSFQANWSQDGKYLAYYVVDPDTKRDLWYLTLDGEQKSLPYLESSYDESMPRISPDGKYIAYQSDESGQWEIYIQPFPEGPGRDQVSVNGGENPKWSPQGNELFYIENDSMMAVSIQTTPTLMLGIPQTLFSGDQIGAKLGGGYVYKYEVDADGSRFLVVRDIEEPVSSIVLIQNWHKEFDSRE